MSKKTSMILIVVAAVAMLLLGVYLLFFTKPPLQNSVEVSSDSPFGTYNGSTSVTPNTTASSTTESDTTEYSNDPASPLTKISTQPISGAEVFSRKITSTSTMSVVRYIERATGHTQEYDKVSNTLTTSSNTTIPAIYKALWSGNTVVAQIWDKTNKNLKTFSGNLPSSTTPSSQLSGNFLSNGIYDMTISPKGNRIFTLTTGENAIGSISNLDGTKKTSVFNFPFNEWLSQWPSENTITLTTRPSFSAPGYMYLLTTSGSMTKAMGAVTGLTTLTSPDLNYVLYSTSVTGGFTTSVNELIKGGNFTLNNNATLPEKCVWSKLNKKIAYCAVPSSIPIANYPDDWYRGSISFVDNIYKLDLSLPAMQLLYSLPKDQKIDAVDLFMDAKEENLYFTNRNDYYLWGLTIKGLTPTGV